MGDNTKLAESCLYDKDEKYNVTTNIEVGGIYSWWLKATGLNL